MFILSGPYNSSFLGKSLRNTEEPVIALPGTKIPFENSYKTFEPNDYEIFTSKIKILTSLEDSIPFLNTHFSDHQSIKAANFFKDKFLFRKQMQLAGFNNQFNFEKLESPTTINCEYIKNNPKVLKPVNGISSKNVTILKDINKDFYLEASQDNPYILEDYIDGTELAVDGYYDSCGVPVILNIMQHDFFNNSDVSDTFYWTNLSLVQEHMRNIDSLLFDIRQISNYPENFPFHMECRKSKITGEYVPIEVNPLRFAGYGTCEIAHYAYNINPYKAFFKEKAPKWGEKGRYLLDEKESCYGFVCLNKELNHRETHDLFDEVLEYRFIPMENDTKIIVLFRTNNLEQLKEKIGKLI